MLGRASTEEIRVQALGEGILPAKLANAILPPFVALLRFTMGWVFVYSGFDKLLTDFSAGGYLANATKGPLTGLFQSLGENQAALNVIDEISKNRLTKFPLVIIASVPSALVMSIFNYKPIVLFALMAVSNFFRVKKKVNLISSTGKELAVNKPLFYTASYLYIILVVLLTFYIEEVYAPSLPSVD